MFIQISAVGQGNLSAFHKASALRALLNVRKFKKLLVIISVGCFR